MATLKRASSVAAAIAAMALASTPVFGAKPVTPKAPKASAPKAPKVTAQKASAKPSTPKAPKTPSATKAPKAPKTTGASAKAAPAKTSASGRGSAKKTATTAATTTSGTTTTGTTTTTTTTTSTWKPNNPVAQKLSTKPNLLAKVQSRLPAGIDLNAATAGFKNFGQFIAATNVSKNHDISFAELKASMTGITLAGTPTGEGTLSLGQSIQRLKPSLDGDVEATKALTAADAEIASTSE